jgi:hypothetical protein
VTARASPNGHRPGPPHQTADWDREDYRPDPATPLRGCSRCGAVYVDDEPSRVAHVTVFGHSPKPREPAKQESTGGESR